MLIENFCWNVASHLRLNQPKQNRPFCFYPLCFLPCISILCFWHHYSHSCRNQQSKVHVRLLHHCVNLRELTVAILSPNIPGIRSPLRFHRHKLSSGLRHLLCQQSPPLSNRSSHLQDYFCLFIQETLDDPHLGARHNKVLGTHQWATSILELIFWWWM